MILIAGADGLEAAFAHARRCFSCGEALADPAEVWWNGYAEDGSKDVTTFALHAGCAAKLAIHLGSDALKADLKNGRHDLDHGSPLRH